MSIKVTVMSLDFESNQPPKTQVFNKQELSVGREENSDLVLSSPEISGQHAKISIKNEGGIPRIYVTDLGSSNGTLIESKPLSPNVEIPMASHERIVIGNYLIKPEIAKEEVKAVIKEEVIIEPKVREIPTVIKEEKILQAEEDSAELVLEPAISTKESLTNGFASKQAKLSSGTVSGILSEDLEQVITLEAKELFVLSGKVLRKGQPLSGVRIDAGPLGLHVSDEQGYFEFKNVPEDSKYRISASKQGYIFEEASVDGILKRSEQLSMHAKKLLTLKGKVIHKGVPLAGVTIDGGALGTTLTAADGSYIFRDVPEGTAYSISAKKDGYTFA